MQACIQDLNNPVNQVFKISMLIKNRIKFKSTVKPHSCMTAENGCSRDLEKISSILDLTLLSYMGEIQLKVWRNIVLSEGVLFCLKEYCFVWRSITFVYELHC